MSAKQIVGIPAEFQGVWKQNNGKFSDKQSACLYNHVVSRALYLLGNRLSRLVN